MFVKAKATRAQIFKRVNNVNRFLPFSVTIHASHQLGCSCIPELDCASAVSNSKNVALFDP